MTCSVSAIPMRLPNIDLSPHRRLTALVNAESLPRESPAVYVIEDAHWIDEVSEAMIAEFLTVTPQAPPLALVAYRPEYQRCVDPGARRTDLALAPPRATERELITRVGGGRTVGGRCSLNGSPSRPPVTHSSLRRSCAIWPNAVSSSASAGAYVCGPNTVDEVRVPATVQGHHRRAHRSAGAQVQNEH